jgi:hypothetical protein
MADSQTVYVVATEEYVDDVGDFCKVVAVYTTREAAEAHVSWWSGPDKKHRDDSRFIMAMEIDVPVPKAGRYLATGPGFREDDPLVPRLKWDRESTAGRAAVKEVYVSRGYPHGFEITAPGATPQDATRLYVETYHAVKAGTIAPTGKQG